MDNSEDISIESGTNTNTNAGINSSSGSSCGFNSSSNTLKDFPADVPLTDIMLPNQWVLYSYDKQLFKKMVSRPNFNGKPYKEIYTFITFNDIAYFLELMRAKNNSKLKAESVRSDEINMDAHDYVIMRKGIEPIWEDPKNSDGGTYTIKMDHNRGYDTWSTFVLYMVGETMTYDMDDINGITVSYIPDSRGSYTDSRVFNGNGSNSSGHTYSNPHPPSHSSTSAGGSFTYIKIWDAKPDRTVEQFSQILPLDLFAMIKGWSLQYAQNNKKKTFGEKDIVAKLKDCRNNGPPARGGFVTYRGRRRK